MDRSQRIPIVSLLLFLIVVIAGLPGFLGDKNYWMLWSAYMIEHDLTSIYDIHADYLPLYQYVLYLYGKIAGSEEAIIRYVNFLRVFTLLFDLIGLWYLYKWIEKKVSFDRIVLICFLNIAYVYNTVIWGQVDGILATLVFISLYYGYKDKPVQSAIFILIALNFKLQAVVFVPLWGLLYINSIINRPRIKTILLPLIAMTAVQTLILLPFLLKENGLQMVMDVVTGSVGKYPKVGVGARNVWNWFLRGNTEGILDSTIAFGGITYNQLGMYMFFLASFIVLLPVLLILVKKMIKRNTEQAITSEQVWLIGALLSMSFYYFNTQMHERYIHPAFIFIAAYSFYKKKFFPFILFSIAYFLNLEGVMRSMNLMSYGTLIFEPLLISILYFIVMTYLYIQLVRLSRANITANNSEP